MDPGTLLAQLPLVEGRALYSLHEWFARNDVGKLQRLELIVPKS
jgi:hypothetical protein